MGVPPTPKGTSRECAEAWPLGAAGLLSMAGNTAQGWRSVRECTGGLWRVQGQKPTREGPNWKGDLMGSRMEKSSASGIIGSQDTPSV